MAITFSRPSEAFQRAHHLKPKHAHLTQRQQEEQQPHQRLPPWPTAARMKRPLDPIDNLSDPLKAKRTRIAVEIFARPLAQALGPSKPILVNRQRSTTQPVQIASSQKPDRPSPIATNPLLPPVPPPTSAPTPTLTPAPTTAPPPSTIPTTTTTAPTNKDHALTRHQEKVINGIRHELGRLQPSAADTNSATGPSSRKLRSQEATRFKSELSAYFPEYDEVIGNDPKEQHLLNTDTPIIVFDGEDEPSDAIATTPTPNQTLTPFDQRPHFSMVRVYNDCLFTDLHNSSIINLDFLKAEHSASEPEDPLPDSHYAPAHRRAERLEKSIRNTEKGRAQHEKDQIIRLLGELQGHDWLRTMGVNGVTESRRKTFEPARDHFIKGCQAILDKFRLWSQEEKRRKLERERALAEETADDEDEDQQESDESESESSGETGNMDDVDMVDVEDASEGELAPEGEPPGYSDVDAVARQLQNEAMERARYAKSSSPRRNRGEPPPTIIDLTPREFTSFFEKKHQRDAALNKGRRRGRTVLAWGQPIPDMGEDDFVLPNFCLDEDTLRAHERQKRRDRRQRRQDATTVNA